MLEKLTDRELDVLSCIIHGRSSKKIALLLHISSRTIEWHIKNIMIKFDCNSRENIISFIEKKCSLNIVNKRYIDIISNDFFLKSIQLIKNSNKDNKVSVTLINESTISDEFIKRVSEDLKKINLKVISTVQNIHENPNHYFVHIYLRSDEINIDKNMQKNTIIVTIDDDYNSELIISNPIHYINFKRDNYFISFFSLLKILSPSDIVLKTEDIFHKLYSEEINYNELNSDAILDDINKFSIKNQYKRLLVISITICLSLILIISIYFYQGSNQNISNISNIKEFKLIKNRIEDAAEYFTTDQTTTKYSKHNHNKILDLQRDMDVLFKNTKYFEEDDLFQSKFSYLGAVLAGHYRWNKNIPKPTEKYLKSEYKQCKRNICLMSTIFSYERQLKLPIF